MMKQEFEERANLKVSPECYHTFIEPGYNASNLDKDEWVKEWKKNGGVQAAYDWECAKRIKAEKAAKGAEGEKTNMAKALIKKADQFNDEEMNRCLGLGEVRENLHSFKINFHRSVLL